MKIPNQFPNIQTKSQSNMDLSLSISFLPSILDFEWIIDLSWILPLAWKSNDFVYLDLFRSSSESMIFTCIFNRYFNGCCAFVHSIEIVNNYLFAISLFVFCGLFEYSGDFGSHCYHQMFAPNCLMQICIDNDINVLRLKAYARKHNRLGLLICCWMRERTQFLFKHFQMETMYTLSQ